MAVSPTIDVEPLTRVPRRGGIKSILEFQSAPRLGVGSTIQWLSDGCGFPKEAPGLCYATTPVTGDKTYDGLTIGEGPVFALYAGVECYLGADVEYDNRARELLELGEARGVEEVLWDTATAISGPGIDVTTIIEAIARVEEHADENYVGQPVLLMSRASAVRAYANRVLEGDHLGHLWTANGTPVVTTAAASNNDVVAIGFPSVFASDITVAQTHDHIVNREMAIAERIYALGIDCEYAARWNAPITTTP